VEQKELSELNKKHGIHGAYQNHVGGRIGSPVWDLFALLKDLDPNARSLAPAQLPNQALRITTRILKKSGPARTV